MRLEKLASPSALGFIAAATPAAIPEGTAGAAVTAATVAAAAIIFIYKCYEYFEEKRHAKEIGLIEELHQEDLAKISIHDCNIVTGFPPIFQKDSDNKYKSMTMTDAQVTSIGNNALRAPTDLDLITYRHHIICAIEALKKYYFLHEDKTGITVQVILYLLNILEKLLQFEGYAFDIAYLNGLCNFICKYASSKGEQSSHFTCLNHVFRHLQYATQKLIHHKETRSQEEMIAELRGTCMFYIDRSIRALTKFALPHTEWAEVDCADPYLLRNTIYATGYIKRFYLGHWTYDDKLLPAESELTHAVCKLTDYYLQTLNCAKQPKIPVQQSVIFAKLSELTLKNIHEIFEAHPEKNPIKPAEHGDMQFIIQTLSQFSALIHTMISFLYFLNELTKMIKNLGRTETDNPSHCKRIYAMHEILSNQIQAQAEIIEKGFIQINRQNNNHMRIAAKECFLRDLIKTINEIKLTIDSQSDAIRERRKALEKKEVTSKTDETPREHMGEVVTQIQTACNILTARDFNTTPTSTPNPTPTPQSNQPRIPRPPNLPRRLPTQLSAEQINRAANTQPRAVPISLPPTIRVNVATQPSAATQNHVVQSAFPKSYENMFITAKTKSSHHNLQLLHLMHIMMDDYTKNNSKIVRAVHGSFFHHHLDEANSFSEALKKKIAGLTNNTDASTRAFLLEELQTLTSIANKPTSNKKGSFAQRVAFLTEKCQAVGVSFEVELPRLAAG